MGWGMGIGYAFSKGCLIGILYLFLPLFAPIFLYYYWDEINQDSTRTPFKFFFGGIAGFIILIVIGGIMFGYGVME